MVLTEYAWALERADCARSVPLEGLPSATHAEPLAAAAAAGQRAEDVDAQHGHV